MVVNYHLWSMRLSVLGWQITNQSFIIKQWILVQDIVEVSDLPITNRLLIVRWQKVQEVEPSQVGLKLDNVFDRLIIVVTEQDLGVILVQDIQFHWGLNNTSDLDKVWSTRMERVNGVKGLTIVFRRISWRVSLPCGAETTHARVGDNVIVFNWGSILHPINR